MALSPGRRQQHEAACATLVVDFANYIDSRRYAELVDLFAPDGQLDRLGTVFSGRNEISRFLEARSPEVVTRHLCTNVRVDVASEDEASGLSYVLFFSATPGAGAALPVSASPPSIVEWHDKFCRVGDDWKIRERQIRSIFKA